MIRTAKISLALAFLLGGNIALANPIVVDSFATTTDNPVIDTAPTIQIEDLGAGGLRFSVSTPNVNGELSAIFIDVAGSFSGSISDLNSETGGTSIVDFAVNTNDLGMGRNLGGNFDFGGPPTASGNFDFGFGFADGDNGGNSARIDLPFVFTLADVLLADIERIGLRFQSVGQLGADGLGSGSEKLISTSVVPLPAAAWFFLTAIGGLLGARKLRK